MPKLLLCMATLFLCGAWTQEQMDEYMLNLRRLERGEAIYQGPYDHDREQIRRRGEDRLRLQAESEEQQRRIRQLEQDLRELQIRRRYGYPE